MYRDKTKYRAVRKKYKQGYRDRTGSNKYARREWPEDEDEKVLKHSITDRELSMEINRSVGAIQNRRNRLKNNVDKIY